MSDHSDGAVLTFNVTGASKPEGGLDLLVEAAGTAVDNLPVKSLKRSGVDGVAYAAAVPNGVFSPTHTVPPEGALTWSAPDPNRPAEGRLDPGLPVEVVAQSGAWVQVRCSNDWVTWVDGRMLLPVAAAPAGPIPGPGGGVAFAPTHQIPAGGLEVRDRPDPSVAPSSWASEGQAVQVVGAGGGWTEVRFDNGWDGWVDGSRLVPWGTSIGGAGGSSANPVAVWMPIGGAVLVILGALLPWLSVIESANAFEIPLALLFDKTSTSTAPDIGWFLLPVVVVLIAPVLGAPLPRPLLGVLGALPIVLVLLFLRLYSSFPSPRPDLGAGLFLTLVGGGVIAAAAALPGRTAPR